MSFQKLLLGIVGVIGILLVALLYRLAGANAPIQPNETLLPTPVAEAALPTVQTPVRLQPTWTPVGRSGTGGVQLAPTPTLMVLLPTPTVALPATVQATPTALEATSSEFSYHQVRSGETLVQIAERYHISRETIIALNSLPASGALNTGQILRIPSSSLSTATTVPGITVNGVPLDQIIIMSDEVAEHVREIYARGQTLGRNPHSFSIIGDSTVEMLNFLTGFEVGDYNLGQYTYLQSVLDYYAGSFARPRMAVEEGVHSRQIFLPDFAEPEYCEPDESMIDCEWRLYNPSVVLIRIGSNDGKPEVFDREVRRMVEYALEQGTIPVIGTKADEFLDPGYTNNQLLRQIAYDYRLPLWDLQVVTDTLPGHGLLPDRVHLTLFYDFDWRMPEAFQTGHGLQNLTALMALDAVMRQTVTTGGAR